MVDDTIVGGDSTCGALCLASGTHHTLSKQNTPHSVFFFFFLLSCLGVAHILKIGSAVKNEIA